MKRFAKEEASGLAIALLFAAISSLLFSAYVSYNTVKKSNVQLKVLEHANRGVELVFAKEKNEERLRSRGIAIGKDLSYNDVEQFESIVSMLALADAFPEKTIYLGLDEYSLYRRSRSMPEEMYSNVDGAGFMRRKKPLASLYGVVWNARCGAFYPSIAEQFGSENRSINFFFYQNEKEYNKGSDVWKHIRKIIESQIKIAPSDLMW